MSSLYNVSSSCSSRGNRFIGNGNRSRSKVVRFRLRVPKVGDSCGDGPDEETTPPGNPCCCSVFGPFAREGGALWNPFPRGGLKGTVGGATPSPGGGRGANCAAGIIMPPFSSPPAASGEDGTEQPLLPLESRSQVLLVGELGNRRHDSGDKRGLGISASTSTLGAPPSGKSNLGSIRGRRSYSGDPVDAPLMMMIFRSLYTHKHTRRSTTHYLPSLLAAAFFLARGPFTRAWNTVCRRTFLFFSSEKLLSLCLGPTTPKLLFLEALPPSPPPRCARGAAAPGRRRIDDAPWGARCCSSWLRGEVGPR